MKTTWFKQKGWFYLPVSMIGYMLVLCFTIFLISVFYAVDNNSHSISDTLYGIFPFFTSAFFIYNWIANNTSK